MALLYFLLHQENKRIIQKTKRKRFEDNKAKKGSLVNVAPACTGSEERSDHIGSIVCSLFLHFFKRLFLGLDPVGSSFTAATRLPFLGKQSKTKQKRKDKKNRIYIW